MSSAQTVRHYAIALGDDALILGHRLSEWCSRAPFLEEDLALANVALDYIGRARMFYAYAATLSNRQSTDRLCSEDDFAYRRDCRQFTNLLIYELPRGDFAFTMARQFLVDSYSVPCMEQLCTSSDRQLAAIGAKAIKESRYHLRRSHHWLLRLAEGTEESHRRLQDAVNELWGYTPELFAMSDAERELAARGIAVDSSALRADWEQAVGTALTHVGISIPTADWQVGGGRRGLHTEWLGHLLSELQFLQRAYPGLEW